MIAPDKVKSKGEKLEGQNIRFRAFLKNRADDDELDAHFLRLHKELFSDYDCSKCNNCCKSLTITLDDGEVAAIAGFLGQSASDFAAAHLVEDDGQHAFKARPCEFLGDNGQCGIKSCRPAVCEGYPYTDRPGRLSRMLSVVYSAEVCPVVFEILERLKEIYRFRNRG
ncbi:MAG: YkgJ family cysteine cluster protein [Deltaproteobacteria bacterium]|nr:YkgJ family cysteine cluster protein [Deltaproteobacteria bacterium]